MENKKYQESLELSIQELEIISGGITEYKPEIKQPSSSDLYDEVTKQVNEKLSGLYGGEYHYYKKEEYEVRSTDSAS